MKQDYLALCSPILKRYLVYKETIKGLSEKTVNEYFTDLRTFFRFIKSIKDKKYFDAELESITIDDVDIEFIKKISVTDIYEYLNYITSGRNNIAKTRARKVSSLKSFFKYLTINQGILEDNPMLHIDGPKVKTALPHYLSLEQSIDLINAIDGKFKERNILMVTIFLNCGLRLSELVSINLDDIKSDNSLYITGKGNKERLIYLNDACVFALNNYLKVRPVDGVKDKKALFLSSFKTRISPRGVELIIESLFKKIGLAEQGFSPHKLRHTAATLMYQHGNIDIRVLQQILGHENLNTTQIYTHTSSKQIKQAFDLNPLSKVKTKTKKQPGS